LLSLDAYGYCSIVFNRLCKSCLYWKNNIIRISSIVSLIICQKWEYNVQYMITLWYFVVYLNCVDWTHGCHKGNVIKWVIQMTILPVVLLAGDLVMSCHSINILCHISCLLYQNIYSLFYYASHHPLL
jgi:hypothetical protein